jgi:hypothetical protein
MFFHAGRCVGLVDGIAGTNQARQYMTNNTTALFCLPSGVTSQQLIRVIFTYLQLNVLRPIVGLEPLDQHWT